MSPTWLYRHFDADGRLLYVGVSLSPIVRLAQHRETSHWFASITRVEISKRFDSREAALAAERRAIAAENPLHNRNGNRYGDHSGYHSGYRSAGREHEPPGAQSTTYTISQFCEAHKISIALFKRLEKEGKVPAMVGNFITLEAAAEWCRAMESPWVNSRSVPAPP